MIEQSNTSEFFKILCKHSINKDPKLAVLEWDYVHSFIEEGEYCICGNPIKENCLIINKKNNNQLIVGNVCVKRFLDKDLSFVFKGIKQLKENQVPNKSFINYCYEKNYIFENQKDFLLNIRGNKIRNNPQSKYKELSEAQKTFLRKTLYKLKLKDNW